MAPAMSSAYPVRGANGQSQEVFDQLAWSQLPGKARWRGKVVEVMIHPQKFGRTAGSTRTLMGIRFKPVRRGDAPAFKAVGLHSDMTERPALSGDITWVCGRSWEGGGDVRGGKAHVLAWLAGKCFSCCDGHGFPDLFNPEVWKSDSPNAE